MMTDLSTISLILSVLGSGVMAGLFFVFSNFAMRALENAPAAQGADVMKSINLLIVNPVFLLLFMGTGVLHIVSIASSLTSVGVAESLWTLASGILYWVGCLFVTIRFNVPLNNRLASVDAQDSEYALVWSDYLKRWVPWNHVRTSATIGSTLFGCISLANG